MFRSLSLAVLLILAGPVPEAATLRWQFKQGETFYMEENIVTRQTVKVQGSVMRQDLDLTRVSRFTVLTATDDKVALEQKIEAVKVKGAAVGPKADAKLLQQMEGATFTITLDARQHVTKLEGYEALIGRMAKGEEEARKVLRTLLTEESLKREAEVLFGFAPDKAVSPGDTWRVKARVPFGPLGTLDLVDTFTLQGADKEDKGRVTISVKTAITYAPPGATNSGLPFKVTEGNLKAQEAKGTLLFDVTKGKLVRYEGERQLQGTLKISAADQKLDLEIEQRQTTTSRVLNRDPLKK